MNDVATVQSVGLKETLYLIIKRLFDIICGLIGLIVLIPVTLIVKIIYICNKDFAPIFFTQNRIGKNGKEFKFYKYRSMVSNADEYKINKKLKNDPRITKVGAFLRKTSLDELPQLINVLKGDMSIIGNRPYLPREKEDMGEYYNDIVKTKPGITGYWQVSGRSNLSFQKRLELEQFYSNQTSLKLDIKIFFKTFAVVLLKKGAK